MIRSKLFVSCAFAAILVLAAAPAWADSVPVTNASFETTNPLSSSFSGGTYNLGPIPGWTTTGVSGSFQPNSTIFSAIPDGSTVGFANGGSISQTLTGNSLLANTSYTLSVFVGNRLDGYSGSYTIALDAGSTTLCSFSGTSSTIKAGTFVDETCSYTSGSSVPAGDLSIILTDSHGAQLIVDNVTVTTPEPGSLALLTAGIGFLFFIARRRKLQLPVCA